MTALKINQCDDGDDPLLVALTRLKMDTFSLGSDKAAHDRTETDYLMLLALTDTCRQLISEFSEKSSELKRKIDVSGKRVDALLAYGCTSKLVQLVPLRKQQS